MPNCANGLPLYKIFMKILILITSIILANNANAQVLDTFYFAHDTVNGIEFSGSITPEGFYLSKSNSKSILKAKGSFRKFEFKDMNNDGYKDIVLYSKENALVKMFFFRPKSNRFK